MVANAIVVAQPRQETGLLLSQANEILRLKGQFRKGVHFGAPYPGSQKDTLLKPGAELLSRRFGLRPRYEALQSDIHIDWEHMERSYIIYRYRCEMIDIETGTVVGEAIGSCTSLEDKYRYRKAERKCPSCGQAAIIKGKAEYGGGWVCFKKKGGCDSKFADNDPQITDQESGKVVNLNPFDLMNTIDKMAQKRALVSGVLVATGASSYFAPGDDEVKDLYEVPDDDVEVITTSFVVIEDKGQSFPAEPGRSEGDEPKLRWATSHDILHDLLDRVIKLKQDKSLTISKIGQLVGMNEIDALDYKKWDAKFPTGKEAGNAIAAAYDAEMAQQKPATPKAQSTLVEPSPEPEAPIQTKSDLIAAAAAQAEQTSKALNGVPETPKFNPDKAHTILSVTQGRYSNTGRQSFAEFRTEHGPVRLYGMTEALGKVDNLPEGFIENLKAATKFTDLGCMISFQWEMAKNGEYATVKAGTINTDIPF